MIFFSYLIKKYQLEINKKCWTFLKKIKVMTSSIFLLKNNQAVVKLFDFIHVSYIFKLPLTYIILSNVTIISVRKASLYFFPFC